MVVVIIGGVAKHYRREPLIKLTEGLGLQGGWDKVKLKGDIRQQNSGLRKYSPLGYFVALQPGIKIDFWAVCII